MTMTVTVKSIRNLPAAILPTPTDASQPAVLPSPRPATAKGAKATGKKEEKETAEDVFTIAYDVPIGPSERRLCWTEKAAARSPTDDEKEAEVRGRWDDAREAEAVEAAQAAIAAEAVKREAAAALVPAKKGAKPATPPTTAPAPAVEALHITVTAPAAPAVSASVLAFDHSQAVFLLPSALPPLSSLIHTALFPVQLTVTRGEGDAGEAVRGVALVDLGELVIPGRTRLEGWWAMTQTAGIQRSPIPSTAPVDAPKKGKPAPLPRGRRRRRAERRSTRSTPVGRPCGSVSTCPAPWCLSPLRRPLPTSCLCPRHRPLHCSPHCSRPHWPSCRSRRPSCSTPSTPSSPLYSPALSPSPPYPTSSAASNPSSPASSNSDTAPASC